MKGISQCRIGIMLCMLAGWSLLSPVKVAAQQETETIDSVAVDNPEPRKPRVGILLTDEPRQIPLEQCDSCTACGDGRYAVVKKDGKYGLYDLKNHRNLTELDWDELTFRNREEIRPDTFVCFFNARRDFQYGALGVVESSNEVVSLFDREGRRTVSLKDCTTLSKDITDKCRASLGHALAEAGGTYGQVAVLEASTGRLKAWVALKRKGAEYVDGPILRFAAIPTVGKVMLAVGCLSRDGVSLDDSVDTGRGVYQVGKLGRIRDYNWRSGGMGRTTYREAIGRHSDIAMFKAMAMKQPEEVAWSMWQKISNSGREINALDLAVAFNAFCYSRDELYPTLHGKKVIRRPVSKLANFVVRDFRDFLTGVNEGHGYQAAYAPQGVRVAGWYSLQANVRENFSDRRYDQISYAGCLPAERPRYVLVLFVERNAQIPVSGQIISGAVNELVEWLADKKR